MADHPESVWIIKPGENSNRGAGITLCDNNTELEGILRAVEYGDNKMLSELITHNCEVETPRPRAPAMSLIVQRYIPNPLLIHKRKFDIRVYGMLVGHYGNLRGYFYEEGYLRTSSKEFALADFKNKYMHLTNDAI